MNASPARRLQAPSLLRDQSFEALAAIRRNSPEAAYLYARDAASAARLLDDAEATRLADIVAPVSRVQGCACAGCEAGGGLCLATAAGGGRGVFWAERNRGGWRRA